MPDPSPYKLEFSADLRDALEMALCDRVDAAVAGATDRNSQLQIWRDQMYGFGVTSQNQTWESASNLYSSLSEEAFLTLLSQISGALRRDPKVAIEGYTKETQEDAADLEAWACIEGNRSDIDARLYDLAHYACWAPNCVGYVGWEQITRKSRDTGYMKKGDKRVYTEEEKQEGEEYDPVPLSEEVVEEKYRVRAVHPSDFFLYPATATSIERATACVERMYMTEEELYDGVGDFGYSRDAVEELCKSGPGDSSSEDREQIASQDGLTDTGYRDGFYEIFTMYTRLPRHPSGGRGEEETPDYLLQDDFLVVLCPGRKIVLKMEFSPFKLERPYFIGSIMPEPEKVQGRGLMAMLEGLQDEATATIQYTFDSADLSMAPAMIGPKSASTEVARYSIAPGAYIGLPDGVDSTQVRELQWGSGALSEGLARMQWLHSRAQALVSAEGQGQLQNKVRKQGEIDNINQQTSAKFGTYLSNFQRTVVAEVFRRMIVLKAQFGEPDEDGEEFVDAEGHKRKLTARALKGKYNIVASGTSLTHSPEARVEIAKQKQAIQIEFLTAKSKLPPDVHGMLWHGARELLIDLGERNPEAWIGDEPQNAPQGPQTAPQGPQQPNAGNGNGQYPPLGIPMNGAMGN